MPHYAVSTAVALTITLSNVLRQLPPITGAQPTRWVSVSSTVSSNNLIKAREKYQKKAIRNKLIRRSKWEYICGWRVRLRTDATGAHRSTTASQRIRKHRSTEDSGSSVIWKRRERARVVRCNPSGLRAYNRHGHSDKLHFGLKSSAHWLTEWKWANRKAFANTPTEHDGNFIIFTSCTCELGWCGRLEIVLCDTNSSFFSGQFWSGVLCGTKDPAM